MSFPKHLDYKESGCSWLGKVPLHWQLHKLKHVADIVGGGTPSREKLEYWNGDIPWVSPKDMKSERISSAEECITELGLKSSTTSLQETGRVLMVIRSGILQHTLPVAINAVPVALNQDMKSFSFDESKCLPEFFLRWVQGLNDDLLLAWANEGATVESINQTLLQNTILPLPDVDEQKAISSFLDVETSKIDGLVSEQRRLIELLKEKRQAVISHAVTKGLPAAEARQAGLNPNAPMKPSGIQWLGDVPQHWEVAPLKYLSDIKTGFAFKSDEFTDDGVPVLRIGDISMSGTVDFSDAKYLPTSFIDEHEDALVQQDDIVMAMTGATIGKAAKYTQDTPALLNQRVCIFRAFDATAQPFVWFLLQTSYYAEYLAITAFGGAQPNISDTELVGVSVPIPPLPEQQEIASYLDSEVERFTQLQAEAERAIELLQERRTALISAAVTGKIDVRQFTPQEAS